MCDSSCHDGSLLVRHSVGDVAGGLVDLVHGELTYRRRFVFVYVPSAPALANSIPTAPRLLDVLQLILEFRLQQ